MQSKKEKDDLYIEIEDLKWENNELKQGIIAKYLGVDLSHKPSQVCKIIGCREGDRYDL